MMTTTSTTLDPELENRLVVLGVDEDPAQTQAIIAAQRASATLEGFSARAQRERQRQRHHHIQRLLDPVAVVIPEVSLVFPSSATRHRRDHAKLLSLITALALLHQHQRERRTEMIDGVPFTYVEATPEDIEVASELCRRVLVRDAEALAPQARRLLAAVRTYAGEEASRGACEAAEIDVTRELLGWSDTQVRAATERLVALEYLVVSGGGRGRCRTYRLVPDFAPLPQRDSDDGGEVRGDDARQRQPLLNRDRRWVRGVRPLRAPARARRFVHRGIVQRGPRCRVGNAVSGRGGRTMKVTDAVTDYLTWCGVHGYAEGTLRARRYYLASFASFLDERDVLK